MPAKIDLDALFGVDAPIVVTWKNRDYELARPRSFGPLRQVRFFKLQSEVAAYLSKIEGEIPADQAEAIAGEIERVVHLQIELINPELGLALAAERAENRPTYWIESEIMERYGEVLRAEAKANGGANGDGDPKVVA